MIMMGILKLSEKQVYSKFTSGNATTVVFGLGWMGLSTACLYAEAGSNVIGVDKNSFVVDCINKGKTPFEEKNLSSMLRKNVSEGRLKASLKGEEAASEGDAIIIIVPIGIDDSKRADYTDLRNVSRTIGKGLQEGSCIIAESTCAPMVTEKIVKSVIEKYSGLDAGVDFALAYSPIRAMAGRVIKDFKTYPRVIGGFDKRSLDLASQIVSLISREIVKVTNIKTAEATKIFETIYRDVNIALSNEFADLCEKIGTDYYEIMEAANTQPHSHLHRPSVGVGGHCLPVYPYLLLSEVRNIGIKMKMVMDARKLNEDMPRKIVTLAKDGLKTCRKSIIRGDITVLGITYRPDVKEIRYSPSLSLISILKRRGSKVTVYDPLYNREELDSLKLKSEQHIKLSLKNADCVIIAVQHKEFQELRPNVFKSLMDMPAVIVDGVGLFHPKEVERLGLVYRGLGRGTWTK